MTAKFQIGDIVWAKMPTYPPWPGIIITPVANVVAKYNGGESQHFVKFYGAGTNDCSWIPDKDIKPNSDILIEKARKNKKLKKAIDELEKEIGGEKKLKKNNKKRKRDHVQIEVKSKKTKVSGETNKEIKETHVIIEDPNVYKNQQDIDEDHQIQEGEANEAPKIHQNEDKFDKSHKIQDKVTEHPKINENQEEDKDGEIEKQCVQEIIMVEEQVFPIKDCVTEKDSTPPERSIDKALKLILFSDEICSSEFWKDKSGKIQALKHLLKVIEVLKEGIKKEESLKKQKFEMQYQEKGANKDHEIHQNKDEFDNGHKMLKQQGKVTKHTETHEKRNMKNEDNNGVNKEQCVPEMTIVEQRVLSAKDCITEKNSSPSEQSTDETLEPILFSDKALSRAFWENVISDGEEQTEAFLKTHFKPSSENEFDKNVSIIIPIRPNDIDELPPQKGLNVIHQQLPESLIKPFEVSINWNSRKNFCSEFVPSPIKFGFTGYGVLKSRIVKNLLLSKHDVTLLDDATTENIEAKEIFNLHGAKRVKTFDEFMENCDIIFSYWENTRTVKSQMLQALCSVSKEVFAKKGYVELSTLDPETAYQVEKAITCNGGRFLEVAVLGDMLDAEDGHLVVLASGDQGLFNECSSTFQAIAKYSYFYKGNIGRGSIMKIGHSMIQGTALAGLAEVVAFIQRHGFKEDEFTDILSLTPFQHKFWVEKAKSMFRHSYIPCRPVADLRRDFQFGLGLASSSLQPMWTCSAANQILKRVINYGYDEDVAANS